MPPIPSANYARPRITPSRAVLTLSTVTSEEQSLEDEFAILAIDSSYSLDLKQRGQTCYVCFQTGHPWLDCPYLRHLSVEEKEKCAYRRRMFFERRKAAGNNKPWIKPGWESNNSWVPNKPSWKEDPTAKSSAEVPDAENAPSSPQQ
jgi:hypothetical protein